MFCVLLPCKIISPFVGESNKESKCKKVDLPEPEGPTSAINLPLSKFKFTFDKTLITDLLFLNCL